MDRRCLFAYLLALLVVAADQASKLWASNTLVYLQPFEVMSLLNWMLAYNTGAAWSFLANAGGWQRWLLAGISAVVSLMLIVWLARLRDEERVLSGPLALILGGAIGNLIDRVLYGYVIDFIQMHYERWFFPTYNVAVIAISIGAFWLLLASWLAPKRREGAA